MRTARPRSSTSNQRGYTFLDWYREKNIYLLPINPIPFPPFSFVYPVYVLCFSCGRAPRAIYRKVSSGRADERPSSRVHRLKRKTGHGCRCCTRFCRTHEAQVLELCRGIRDSVHTHTGTGELARLGCRLATDQCRPDDATKNRER